MGAHKCPRGSGSLSSQDHQAPAKKYKERKKSSGAYQNNAASFFTSPNPTRLLAVTEAFVQLCPDKRKTGTVLVELPRLSAQVPPVMPSYPADLDWGFHTVNLLL